MRRCINRSVRKTLNADYLDSVSQTIRIHHRRQRTAVGIDPVDDTDARSPVRLDVGAEGRCVVGGRRTHVEVVREDLGIGRIGCWSNIECKDLRPTGDGQYGRCRGRRTSIDVGEWLVATGDGSFKLGDSSRRVVRIVLVSDINLVPEDSTSLIDDLDRCLNGVEGHLSVCNETNSTDRSCYENLYRCLLRAGTSRRRC